ncbi:MAG: hypothetical protein IIY51_06040 [Erysipelotrichaceae bacterium]|nr:hypothetical protein [Erysipelotrichaceae bacterium]MBR6957290.1 hypothetical protein [Erysipelotrichaceae bacterium]
MSGHKGMILMDAMLGLLIISITASLIYGAASLRNSVEFEAASEDMEELWRDEDYLEIYDPAKPALPEPIADILPQLEIGQDLPLLN